MAEIKNVYLGLPSILVDRVHWVPDEDRINTLSLKPGGFEMVVEYQNGKVLGYDKVKTPASYLATFFSGKVKTIFARRSVDEKKFPLQQFERVWNSEELFEPVVLIERLKKLKLQESPVWVPVASLTTIERNDGTESDDGLYITFNNLSADLSLLNGRPLRMRGKGPIVRICIAKAVRADPERNIKAGDTQLRCFAV